MRLFSTLCLVLTLQPSALAFAPRLGSAVRLVQPQTASRPSSSWRPVASAVSVSQSTTCLKAAQVAAAEEASDPTSGGTATIPEEIFNLVKGIVGAGVLSLPAGIAAFGSAPSAALPAVILIAVIGSLSAYGFGLTGRVCALTKTATYRSAWSASMSEKSSWIPAWTVTFKTFCAILAYSMILADTFQSLLGAATGITYAKTLILPTVTVAVLLPLCLLRNLSSLAPFSLLGSLGMLYTAIAMFWRYATKAYTLTGKFGTDMPVALRPAFGNIGAAGIMNAKASILIGMLSTAYMAHFNAPKFFVELKDNTVPRYLTVVGASFGIAIGLFAAIGGLGFLTFGAHSSGLILNNYSPRDTLMSISKIAVALSLVFSYPLAFTGLRDGVLDLLNVKERKAGFVNGLTVGLLSLVTVAALIIPDVSFVLSFAGSTLGNALVYIYPALMFRGAIKKVASPTRLQKAEVKAALGCAVAGLGMGILGAVKAVQSIL